MAIRDITAQRVRELFHYDPETGILTRRLWRSCRKAGAVAGTFNRNYLQVMVDRNLVLVHRLIWLYMTGEWPGNPIDHIDGDKVNNRWANLREVTKSGNQQNCIAHKRNLLGIKNVSYDPRGRKHYRVTLSVNHATAFDERFETLEQAIEAAAKARARLHPFCARNQATFLS